MTTLPTTTAIRMPRQPTPTALAAPQQMGLSTAAATPAAGTMTANDVMRVLRANFWLIILSLIIFGILGVVANQLLLKFYPRFTAVGFIRVELPRLIDIDRKESEIPDVGPLGIMSKTQAQLLRQSTLFSSVLADSTKQIQQTGWIQKFRKSNGTLDVADAREDLEDYFSVSPIQDSQLVRISMTTKNAKDARIIVEDIVNQHLSDQDKGRRDRNISRMDQLNTMKRKLEYNNNANANQIRTLQKELNDAGMATTNRVSPRENELFELTRKQIEIKSDYEQAKSQYEMMAQQFQQGIDPASVEQFVNEDNQLYQLRSNLSQSEVQLLSMPSQGSNSRNMDQARAQVAAFQHQIEDRTAEVKMMARNQIQSSTQQAYTYMQAQFDGLTERINQLRNELGDLNYKIYEVMSKQGDLESDKDRLKEVQNQLDLLGITGIRDMSGVSWAGLVDEPEIPSFPRMSTSVVAALLCGLALSLAIAFIREAMDTTVRSPRDIAKVGQLNLLGMIPDENDDPQVAGIPLPLAIFQAPTSVLAEQFRQVRTRLQHTASLDTTRSILVTSPSPGDGKSTVATNIAAGLALNGRRILLVDVNFRRPMIHKIFNATNEVGFGNVLTDASNLENAVKSTQVPNLDILPCGPKLDNATELLESQGFTDFMEKALEQYDHVLFDSGPLLMVSETVALAPRVDGVISVVRAATNTRGVLTRLRDNLRQVKAEHLGVVLNGVRAQGGGYYGRNIRDYYEYQNGESK